MSLRPPLRKILEDKGEGLFAFLRCLETTFPNDDEVPAICRPRLFVLRITADISTKLRVPKRAV